MARICAGDADAFAALFDRYGDIVYSVSIRILRDEAAAEDVVQDVFVRLWRRPDRFDAQRGQFVSWLVSVARHRAIDEHRSLQRRQRYENAAGVNGDLLPPPTTGVDPILAALVSENRAEVRSALAGLPDEQRRTIELAYFGGLTQREIAEALQQPLGTVKTRIRLGMSKLRAALTNGVVRE
jgi:RNA polymerase sigma-70 factor (ECF subfamily)